MSQRILLKKHSKTCIGYFVIDLLITQFVFRLVHASCSWKQHLMIGEKWSSLQWPCFSPRCPQTQIWSSIEANSFVLERNSHKGKFCVRNWIYFNQADSQSWLTKLFLNVATDLVYCLSLSFCVYMCQLHPDAGFMIFKAKPDKSIVEQRHWKTEC